MKKEEILNKYKAQSEDELEVKSKEKSGLIMVVTIFVLTCLVGIVRISRSENVMDICVIFTGALAVQNFYMYSKCKKKALYLAPAIIATGATIICFIAYYFKG